MASVTVCIDDRTITVESDNHNALQQALSAVLLHLYGDEQLEPLEEFDPALLTPLAVAIGEYVGTVEHLLPPFPGNNSKYREAKVTLFAELRKFGRGVQEAVE